MQIHQANIVDSKTIAPLFDLYRQFYQQPSDLEKAELFLRHRLINNESIIFYVSQDSSPIGFVQLYPSYSSVFLKQLWILNDLYVTPEARRRSVARKLIQYSMDFAKSTGARGLTLKTARDNTGAQRLYESLGWMRNDRFLSFDFTQ